MNLDDFLQLFRALTSSIPFSCECFFFFSFSFSFIYLTTIILATIIVLKGTVTTTNSTQRNKQGPRRVSGPNVFLFYFISFHFTNKYLQLGNLHFRPPPTPPFPPPRRITASTIGRHVTPSPQPKNGRDRNGREGGGRDQYNSSKLSSIPSLFVQSDFSVQVCWSGMVRCSGSGQYIRKPVLHPSIRSRLLPKN